MIRARASPERRASLLYLLVPSAGIAFGMIAVLLGGVVPPSPPVGGYGTTPTVFTNREIALLSGLALAAFGIVILALRSQGGSSPHGPTLLAAVGILLAVLILLALLDLASPPVSTSGASPRTPPTNTTTGPPVNPTWQTPPVTILPPAWPPWVPYALLVVVLIVVTIAAGPLLQALRYRSVRRAKPPTRPAPPRAALQRALSDLTDASGRDPREVIIALYGQLLEEVGDRAGRLEPRTPREIEARIVDGLGIRRTSAQVLTGLFEEARYSTIPLSEANVDRARSSLREALSSLAPAASA
ncbi:MAG: DUF4129 domain-containing protein [Thermoplasmata archaeon]|nr:DUF4129 domain-containing protein [Thermoplasmata archaeon]